MNRPTSIEFIMQNAFQDSGIDFIPEYRIGRWCVDIFLPKYSVAVECDGTYWHSKKSTKERDKRKDIFLIGKGIRVIRLQEAEINSSVDDVMQKVHSFLNIDHDRTQGQT